MMEQGQQTEKITIHNVWKVYLRLSAGGIMILPFPAETLDRANKLAELAAVIFDGVVLDVLRVDDVEYPQPDNA